MLQYMQYYEQRGEGFVQADGHTGFCMKEIRADTGIGPPECHGHACFDY